MKKDLFLDSSIIIEFFKHNQEAIKIFEFILQNIEIFRININAIVWSEIVYQLIIKRKFPKNEIFEILNSFRKLEINSQIIELAENLIGELYSNDALNFATAYYFKIDFFITLDNDFKSNEDIKVIHSLKELKETI